MNIRKPDVDESRNPWTTLAVRVAYSNPWITVEHRDVVDPSGKNGVYGVVRPNNLALGVLPIFDNGDTLLVGQFRYAQERYSWEMPEGGGSKNSDPLESIQRELAEETGYRAGSWLEVQRTALSNSVSDEEATTWVAWDLEEGEAEPETTEELALWRLPFATVVTLVENGTIFDAMTVSTVLAVEIRRMRADLPSVLLQKLQS
jgi:8-oxo-dGTP pyrophosphatase MutT (NUDIX family)